MNRTVLLLRALAPMLVLLLVLGQPFSTSAQCPTVTPVGNDPGQCYATNVPIPSYTVTGTETSLTWSISAPSNASSGAGIHPMIPPSQVFNIGASVVTFTAIDGGVTTTCSFTVTVNDVTPPTAMCVAGGAVTLNLDGTGNATLSAAQIDNGSSDACSNVTNVSVLPSMFNCTTTGVQSVTLTATDFSGNTASCTTSVTVKDNTPPTVTCKPASTNINGATGMASIVANDVLMTANDNCAVTSLALNISNFDCSNIGSAPGTNSVTLTATDASMNSATCTAIVTVTDNNPPMALASASISAPNEVDCDAIPAAVDPTVTGVCMWNIQSYTESFDNGGATVADLAYYDYTITRTWVIENANNTGLTTTVTQTIDVLDQSAPTFSGLPTAPVMLSSDINNSCLGTANLTLTDVNIMDNCSPDANITIRQKVDIAGMPAGTYAPYDAAAIATFPIGTSTVTFEATDVAMNTSFYTITVVVTDNAVPTFDPTDMPHCGMPNIVLNNIPGSCGNSFSWNRPGIGTLMDCSNLTVTESISDPAVQNQVIQSFGLVNHTDPVETVNGFFAIGSTVITYTATDGTNTATCSFTVQVDDVQAPTMTCPPNLTLNTTCPTDILPNYTNDALVSDNCLANVSVTQSPLPGTDLMTITTTAPAQGDNFVVTLSASDGMTTPATCNFTVTLNDGMLPIPVVATLPAIIEPCESHILDAPAANDNCNPTTPIIYGTTSSPVATLLPTMPGMAPQYQFDYIPGGPNSYTITWVYDDMNGNITTQQQSITIQKDVTPPAALCMPVTLNLPSTANPMVSLTAAQVDDNSFDNCGIASMVVAPSTFDCSHTSAVQVVTLTVTDDHANTASCTANVTIKDITSPVITCKDATVDLSTMSTGTISATDIQATATDNCSIASAAISKSDFNCTNLGANLVTLTVTDASGNSSTCTSTVSVIDNSAPIASNVPQDVTVDCAEPIVVAPMFTDPCGLQPVVYTSVITGQTCPNNYIVTRTWTATDNSNNTTTTTQVITVQDLVKPVFNAAMVTAITLNTAPGSACSAPFTHEITADSLSDNCTAFSMLTKEMSVDYPTSSMIVDLVDVPAVALTSFPLGVTTITYVAEDLCGNSTSKVVTITVKDVQAPVFNGTNLPHCGNTITLSNIPGTCGNVFTWNRPSNIDITDCSLLNITENIDNNIVFQSVTSTFGAYTNGQNTETVNGLFPLGETIIAYTATDGNMNTTTCSFVVKVQDTQNPTLNCPTTLVLNTTCPTAAIPSYLNDVQVTDNCPNNVMLTQSPASGALLSSVITTPAQGSTFVVTVTATDAMPNTTTPATCAITVTLNDGMAPVPTVTTLPAIIDSCGSLTVLAPTANEACNPLATTIYGTPSANVATFLNTNPPSYQFDYSATGSNNYVITWIYDDGNGNSTSQVQNITILPDTFPATAICQPLDIVLQADGDTTILASMIDNGSFDPNGCGGALTFSLNKTVFSCADLAYDTLTMTTFGLDTVMLTVTDGAGNTSTCQTTVRVTDVTAPFFNQNIPNDTTIQACAAIPAAALITAFDACDPMAPVVFTEVSTQDTVGAGIYNYTITRNWWVKDTSGNTASATQVISVVDNMAPTFVGAPTAITHLTGPDRTTCSDTVFLDMTPYVMDCAPFDSLILTSNDGIVNGLQWKKELGLGTHTAIFTARDQSGNVGTHTVTITVLDGTPPLAACVNGISVSLSPSGNVSITTAQVNNNSSDNCGPITMVVTPSTFNCNDVGPVPPTIKLTVTDAAGNTASCNTYVDIQDNVAPVLTCPKDTVVNCDASTDVVSLGSPINIVDNCSAAVTVSNVDTYTTTSSPICRNLLRTWSVEDVFGNIGTCVQTISIQDTIFPVFAGVPVDDTLSCELPIPAAAVVTVMDNCTPSMTVTMVQDTIDRSAGLCGKYEYTIRRTWSAMDSCGNNVEYAQHIHVLDTVAPSFVGLADTVYFYTNAVASNPDCGVEIDFDLYDYVVDCADSTDIAATSAGTNLVSNGAFNLSGYYAVGTYTASIAMADPCGNAAVDTVTFIVVDNTSPQPDCIDQVVVALNSDGEGDLDVADVNLNSFDNCGIDTIYLTQSLFDCSDLGTQMEQMIVVDINGNSNACDVLVIVQQGAASTFTATLVSPDTTTYFGATDGVLGVTATGGSGNFSYAWSTNATSNFITGLAAGTYTVTVSDDLTNCQMVLTGEVIDGPAITLTLADVTGPVGGTVSVPITAQDFNNITQMSFQVNNVNTAVASLTGVSNVNPAFGTSLTTIPTGAGASLIVLWSNATSISMAPTDVLFSVDFDITGNIGDMTPVDFSTFIGLKQIQNGTPVDVPGVGVNGSITVGSSGGLKLAGKVEFWANQAAIANVTAKQVGQPNALTNAAGAYTIDVPYGSDENLSMEKFTAGNTNITSADLLRMVNNMFGTPFTSPYQWIAADANGDGNVTVADITKIQRLVLGSVAHLDALPDWVFVPKSYTFPTTSNPISTGFPTSITRTGIAQDYLSENFIGVRRGDVNGDSPLTLLAVEDRFGNNTPFVVTTEEQVAAAGTQIVVPFRAKDFNQRSGFQMTIDFDPSILTLNHIENGVLDQNDDNFGLDHLSKGQLTTLWYNRAAVSLENDEILFSLTFDVKADLSTLSDVLSVNSAITKAEGYDAFGENMPLQLDYVLPVGNATAMFDLQQNRPNPFKDATTIGFVLAQDDYASLRFYDATGKLVRTFDGNFVKGYNQIEVLATDLGTAGIYWYEISTKSNTDRKKLVIIK